MRARVITLAVVAALALPVGASADPKPTGCAGVAQVTGTSCTFVVEAGNEGVLSYALVSIAAGAGSARIDVLRGTTVVATSGSVPVGYVHSSGRLTFDPDAAALPAGTYRCRVTLAGPMVANPYECAVA